jgi:nucleoid DNA-binding protein
MNKKDLIGKVVEVLRANDVRKNVASQKTTLHISDDYGNSSDFIIKKSDTGLLFTNRDVGYIVDALLAVIEDSLKHGEEVSVHGFGSLGVHKRAARQTVHPTTGATVEVDERYVPKFNFGNTLRMAAKVYELSLEDKRGCK